MRETCLSKVRAIMSDGKYHALGQLSKRTGYGETTISAQIRKLRQPKYGRIRVVLKRDHRARGFSYRLIDETNALALDPVMEQSRKCRCASCGGRGFKWGRVLKLIRGGRECNTSAL